MLRHINGRPKAEGGNMKERKKQIKVRSTCWNNLPVWKGPSGGIQYECFRYGKPCRAVETCPHKTGTAI
jgi:hypothetical protein